MTGNRYKLAYFMDDEEITKAVAEIHILQMRSPFACDILRRLLLPVSVAKQSSAALRYRWLRKMKPQFGSHQHP